VPALAEVLDVLLPKVSFLSVGTNDLTQFLFAADRANPKLAERYDWLSPAILRFLARVTQSTAGSGVDLGICGEMGGRRLEALALLGLGFRRFSITPVSVGPIKELVRKVDLPQISAEMKRLLSAPGADIRAELNAWADANGIDTD
jgi:phosphotransferase system enzyme I (PtsP)